MAIAGNHASTSSSKHAPTSASGSKPSSSAANLLLTPRVMMSFKPAKLFREYCPPEQSYTSISFDDRGRYLLTAGEDNSIHVYDCVSGKHLKHSKSEKYGVLLARYTHKTTTIIHTSTKEDDSVRYLSLHDNSYIRYFRGHKRKVTSLEVSPADDTFLSAAADDTVRLWDLRSHNAAGFLNVAGPAGVAYDPSGLIFGVTTNLKNATLLYDIRKLDADPFAEINIADPVIAQQPEWQRRIPVYTSLKFSNDGQHMLVGTSSGTHYVLHGFNYHIVARLEGHQGLENVGQPAGSVFPPHAGISGAETSWSPDGRYVISGSADGSIYVWDVLPPPGSEEAKIRQQQSLNAGVLTLQPLTVLAGHKTSPSRLVCFNHRYGMFVSAGTQELAMWLPADAKSAAEDATI